MASGQKSSWAEKIIEKIKISTFKQKILILKVQNYDRDSKGLAGTPLFIFNSGNASCYQQLSVGLKFAF